MRGMKRKSLRVSCLPQGFTEHVFAYAVTVDNPSFSLLISEFLAPEFWLLRTLLDHGDRSF